MSTSLASCLDCTALGDLDRLSIKRGFYGRLAAVESIADRSLSLSLKNYADTVAGLTYSSRVEEMAAILISTLVSTISEYTSSLAYQRLSQEGNGTLCFVRRNGVLMEIPTDEIVFGDRVILSAIRPRSGS